MAFQGRRQNATHRRPWKAIVRERGCNGEHLARSTSGEVIGLSSRAGRVRLPHGLLTKTVATLTPSVGLHRGTVRKMEKRRSSNLRDCLWVRLPPVLLAPVATANQWPVGLTARMRDPHSRGMGSIPIRVTDIAKWRNWDTRGAQNVVSLRHASSNLALATFCRCDRCPAGFHTAGPLGSIPRPATNVATDM